MQFLARLELKKWLSNFFNSMQPNFQSPSRCIFTCAGHYLKRFSPNLACMNKTPAPRKSLLTRALRVIEVGGNKLPDPATLFLALSGIIMLISWLAASAGTAVKHPGTGDMVAVKSLLSKDGLDFILTSLVKNFTGFAPLGTVLVALLGIGVAEGSGLISAAMRLLVNNAPRRLLTAVIVFACTQQYRQ